MAKDCYLEIDGKRTKLTDEQLKALGIYEEPNANPFERAQRNKEFYYISFIGEVEGVEDGFMCLYDKLPDKLFDVANYCTDESLMQQRALHETLNRLLWRFSMENDGDKIDWNDTLKEKCLIYFDSDRKSIRIHNYHYMNLEGTVFFYSEEIAQRAIDEIINPFMEKHPDFVW